MAGGKSKSQEPAGGPSFFSTAEQWDRDRAYLEQSLKLQARPE